MPPEKQGGRGRESDLLILYVTLNQPEAYTSIALKQMLETAARQYLKDHGTMTSGLRMMAEHLNGILLEHNLHGQQSGEPVIGLLSLVAMRDNVLYLAQSGPTHSLFISQDRVEDYSDPLTSGRGLGSASAVNLKYYQVEVSSGDVFVMAPYPSEAWTADALAGSSQLTLEHLRKRLLNQANPDLQAVVVKFQPGPGQVHLLRPRGAAAQAPASAAAVAPEVAAPAPAVEVPPTPLPASPEVPPAVPEATVEIKKEAASQESAQAVSQPQGAAEAPESTLPTPAATTPADVQEAAAAVPLPEKPAGAEAATEAPPNPPPPAGQPLTRSARIRLGRSQGAAPLSTAAPALQAAEDPIGRPAPAPAPARPKPAPRRSGEGKKHLAGAWLEWRAFFARIGTGWRKLTGRLLPARARPAPALPLSSMLFIAIAVPVVVVTVMVVYYLQIGRGDQRKVFYSQALEYAAAAVSQTENTLPRNDWIQALQWLDKTEAISVSDDSRALRKKVQEGLDLSEGILRLDFKPVIRYELTSGARITRLVASSTDIYMLDASQGRVLRLFLTGSGYELDKQFKCGPGPSGSLQVGSLVDMVILPPNAKKATVLAMDANGVMLYCIPGTTPLSTMLTPPDAGWGKAVALALSSDNLLVLDVLSNAVWVYNGQDVEFADPPHLFFDQNTPSLTNVIDLAYYGDDLYLLREDGTITKCTLSNVAFAPTRCDDPAKYGDPRPGRDPSPSQFSDATFSQIVATQPPDPSIYMLDTQGGGIYHFSLLLNFQSQIRGSTASDIKLPQAAPTAFAITPTRLAVLAFGNQVFYGQLP